MQISQTRGHQQVQHRWMIWCVDDQMWYNIDRASICRLYRVPGYWFNLTLRPYLVVMVRA